MIVRSFAGWILALFAVVSVALAEPAAALELVPQTGHTGGVTAVAFQPGTDHVLTASNDGTAILWDAKNGRLLRRYKGGPLSNSFLVATELQEAKMSAGFPAAAGETPAVSAVEFGPDGQWFVMACRPEGFLASMNANSQAIVWDVESGRRIRVFDLAMDSGAIALSPDGRQLLSGGQPMAPDDVKEMVEMGAKVRPSTGVVLHDVTTGNELRQYGGFDVAYDAVGFSPDGQFVLAAGRNLRELYAPIALGAADAALVPAPTGSDDKTQSVAGEFGACGVLQVWNAKTGEQRLKLQPRGGATKAAFSHSGRYILVLGMANTLGVWEFATQKQVLDIRASAGVFSTDDAQLWAVGPTGKLTVWDLASGKEVRSAATSFEGVKDLAMSPDGNRLLVGMTHLAPPRTTMAERLFVPGEAVLFDLAADATIRVFAAKTDPVDYVGVAPNGQRLLAGDNLWDTKSGRKTHSLCDTQVQAFSAAFAPGGKLALVANHRGNRWLGNFLGGLFGRSPREPLAQIADLASGKTLVTLAADYPAHGRVALGFSDDGARGLTAVRGGVIAAWDVATGKKVSEQQIVCNDLVAAFSPDGRKAVVSFHENKTVWWDCEKGEKVTEAGRQKGEPMRPGMPAVTSRDGRLQLAFSDDGSAVLVHETAEPTKVRTLKAGLSPHEILRIIGFDAQDDRFVYADVSSPYVGIWDVATGKRLQPFSLDDWVSPEALAFGPDGKRAATANNDGQVTVWDVATGRKVHAIKLNSPIAAVAFSPDGNSLALGCADRTAVIAPAAPAKTVSMGIVSPSVIVGEDAVLRGHEGPVDAVAFRPDGKLLATACCEDGTTRLWDVATGKELVRIISIQNGSDWLAFTPEGAYDGSAGGLRYAAFRVGQGLDVQPPTAAQQPEPGLLGRIWASFGEH